MTAPQCSQCGQFVPNILAHWDKRHGGVPSTLVWRVMPPIHPRVEFAR